MGFGTPLALLALAALAVPPVIHLRQRRTPRPLQVGSIRHLAVAPAPPRSGLRLTERWLLALRLAVVGLLALAIAEPFLSGSSAMAPRRIALVTPAAAEAAAGTPAARLLDSLSERGFERRALGAREDVWRALRAAAAELPAGSSLALVAGERVRAGGIRPAIAAPVSVHLFPGPADSAPEPRVGPAPARRAVTIAAPRGRADDARYLAAAFRAVADLRADTLDLSVISIESLPAAGSRAGGWLVWLPDSTTPGSPPAVQRNGESITWILGHRFSADSGDLMLSGELPELVARTWPDPAAATSPDSSLRRMSADQLLPARSAPARGGDARTPVGMPLLAAAALLFLAERWMAHRGVWRRT